jgi:hypothetical protein
MNTSLVDSLYSSDKPGFLMGEPLLIVGQPQLKQVRAQTGKLSRISIKFISDNFEMVSFQHSVLGLI